MAPRRTAWMLAVLVALWVVATVGGMAAPALMESHAVVLALATPRSAFVAAAASTLPLWAFLPLFVLRLSLGDPLHFLLGRAHGRAGLDHLARRVPGSAGNLRRAERAARRVGLPLTALVPTGTVMAAAGMVRLPFGPALTLNLLGTAARLVGLWVLGRAAPELVLATGRIAALVVPPLALVALVTALLPPRRPSPAAAGRARHPTARAAAA